MIEIGVPGFRVLRLTHLVLDYNGTIALDGYLIEGVQDRLIALARQVQIHVLTADTFGKVEQALRKVPCQLQILPPSDQDIGKLKYIDELGASSTVCIGNGRNDRLMLRDAGLGIAVLLQEGAAVETISAADTLCPDVLSALDMLSNPLRIVAALRT